MDHDLTQKSSFINLATDGVLNDFWGDAAKHYCPQPHHCSNLVMQLEKRIKLKLAKR